MINNSEIANKLSFELRDMFNPSIWDSPSVWNYDMSPNLKIQLIKELLDELYRELHEDLNTELCNELINI